MIHSLYDHGDERPAIGLSLAQLKAARADVAGVLWVDVERPTPEEVSELLHGLFGFPPVTTQMIDAGGWCGQPVDVADGLFVIAHAPATRRAANDSPSGPDPSELGIYLGPNYVVTVHREPWPAIAEMRQAAADGELALGRGSDRLVADILAALAREGRDELDGADAAIGRLTPRVVRRPQAESRLRILAVRRRLVHLRSEMVRLRECAEALAGSSCPAVRPANRLYYAAVATVVAAGVVRADALLLSTADLAGALNAATFADAMRPLRWMVIAAGATIILLAAIAAIALASAIR